MSVAFCDGGEVCDQCLELYTKTNSLSPHGFCSLKCELASAEEDSGYAIRSRGTFPRIGYIEGEKFTYPANPAALLEKIKHYPIDLFTFIARPGSGRCYDYPFETDNMAILPVSTYENWISKQIGFKTRNKVRKGEKKGLEVREVPFGDEIVHGIWTINNETPIRQARKFRHYGTTLEWTKEYAGSFLGRSIFLAAYSEGKIVGFVKLVMDHNRELANLLHILSMVKERDKAPTNALIAYSVKVCAERGISQLAYDRFTYGKKEGDSLAEFKVNNGFERVDVPRYYVSMTARGAIARRLGLHRKLSEQVPEFIASRFRGAREEWLRRAHRVDL